MSKALKAHPYRDLAVIDARAPRFQQATVSILAAVALVTGFWPLVALLGAQLVIGLVLGRKWCLPCVAYFELVQPRIGEGPLEDSRAPRFANVIGAIFLLSSTLAYGSGHAVIGGVLAGAVAFLAGLAAVTGLCVGCEIYKVAARLRGIRSKSVDAVDLEQLGAAGDREHVIEFSHPLCRGCQELEEKLHANGESVVLVDVSRRRDLAEKYGVVIVPSAFRVAPGGRVLERVA